MLHGELTKIPPNKHARLLEGFTGAYRQQTRTYQQAFGAKLINHHLLGEYLLGLQEQQELEG